jgi:hypothetical protein
VIQQELLLVVEVVMVENVQEEVVEEHLQMELCQVQEVEEEMDIV